MQRTVGIKKPKLVLILAPTMLRFLPLARLARPLRAPVLRSVHCSAVRRASEASSNGFSRFEGPAVPLYDRLAAHPECLAAIESLAALCRTKTGVDLRGGDSPSMAMMLQLARDPELKKAAERLMTALRDAGIEVDPRQAFEALKTMGGSGFDGVGDLDSYTRGDGEGEGDKGSK